MSTASLAGVAFQFDPTSVTWDFHMKISDRKTVGGKVIQVYGTALGDMTVAGSFGMDRDTGAQPWEVQKAFLAQVKRWARTVDGQPHPTPLRFLYPPKNWDFHVFVKAYTDPSGGIAVTHSAAVFAPKWQMTLHVVQDNSGVVVKGIKDLYLARLMDGVGWKQTDYNGPSQDQVDDLLAGRTLTDFFSDEFAKAASGAATNNTDANLGGTG